MTAAGQALSTDGLTRDEAAARLAARGERDAPLTSRSTASIVRANTLTPFNLILTALGVVTLVFGDWRDALFLGIVVANAGIGIWQELRAKRTLDDLAPSSPRGRPSFGTARRATSASPTWSRATSSARRRAIRSSPTVTWSRATRWSSTSRS